MRQDGRVRGAETGGTKEREVRWQGFFSGEKGETRWEGRSGKIVKQEGKCRSKVDGGRHWQDGRSLRSEGEGENVAEDQVVLEREELGRKWMGGVEWRRLDGGDSGRSLRQEQWEEMRNFVGKSEAVRMAECLGEELGSELNRGMWLGSCRDRRGRDRRVRRGHLAEGF